MSQCRQTDVGAKIVPLTVLAEGQRKEGPVAVLSKQFREALTAIEPGEDAEHAAEAHAEVRRVLDATADLKDWGLETLLIGSYRRQVSIRRVKDADVFCQLPSLPDNVGPQDLLDRFLSTLSDKYGDRVSRNDRSVKVDFPSYDMHVDVVPARPDGELWEIPNKGGGWETTHPLRFNKLTSECNAAHGEQYVPTVKLLRQTRRALMGTAKPGGFFIEIAAFHAFQSIPTHGTTGSPSSTAEYYAVALEKMAPILWAHADGSAPLLNPAVPEQHLHVRATAAELKDVAATWECAATSARTALDEADEHVAAQAFHKLLGTNSEGELVFQVPSRSAAAEGAARLRPGYASLPSGDSPTFG